MIRGAKNVATDVSGAGSANRSRKNPPGPASNWWWPWLQTPNVFRMQANPVEYMTKLGHRYGDICSFLLLTQRGYLINSPHLLKELLAREKEDYVKADWQMKPLRKVVGDGLLTSRGELWKRQRRLIQSVFRIDSLPRYANITTKLTQQHMGSWGTERKVDLMKEMSSLSMAISIRTNFGTDSGASSGKLAETILNVAENLKLDMEAVVSLPDWFPSAANQAKKSDHEYLRQYVDNAIAHAQRTGPGEEFNLLHKLLGAVDEEGDGKGMSPTLVRDEAITMMIAGNHSVSATLAWTWALLLNHDDVLERVEHEVLTVLDGRPPEFADVKRLGYTQQVLQETLRLFPSAWVLFCRQAKRDTYLGPHRIRKGGWVFTVPFVTHRDERFFADPLTFDPDRFSDERVGDIPRDAYFPFGTGPHVCVGKHLALTQITMIIAGIIQKFSVKPLSQRPSLEVARDLAIRPKEGCPAMVALRQRGNGNAGASFVARAVSC